MKRNPAGARVTIDNIVAAGELVKEDRAEPVEIVQGAIR
jgi:hypothetical protein